MFALRRFAPSFSASSARAFSSSPSSQSARISLIGRLARNPEVRTSSRGEEFVTYSVAVSEGSKPDSPTSFFNVSKFQMSEGLKSFLLALPKGTLMHVTADASHPKREGESAPRLMLRQRDLEILSKPRRQPDQDQEQGNDRQS